MSVCSKGIKTENRTLEQLKEQYEIEKKLADTLRNSSKEERGSLYASLYNELFIRVPHHPQLTRKVSSEITRDRVSAQMRFLKAFLKKDKTFLEVGAGDCSLSFEVLKFVKKVYAVDISKEITKNSRTLSEFQLILSTGTDIPLPQNSIDIAYSNQLMEHLHPDDALDQLKNIYKSLSPNGLYLCLTPNRLNGPHDISKHFDNIASGFHLKEYTNLELYSLFLKVGFSEVNVYVTVKGFNFKFPISLVLLLEKILRVLPKPRVIAGRIPLRLFLGIKMVGIKRSISS